jgi:carbonic anhydrase
MDKLTKGVVGFQEQDFAAHRELFHDLKNEQKPHTLFIGCSDSRIVPNLMTQTLPGELFVVRNIANIVPPYHESEEYLSTTSTIEYAVNVLHVENIVICGHSNCGGCGALHRDPDYFKNIPHVRKWLELSEPARVKALKVLPDGDADELEWLTEQNNVVLQMANLLSYPFIREKYLAGTIKILGWYYIIETGEIFNFNKDKGYFEKISG